MSNGKVVLISNDLELHSKLEVTRLFDSVSIEAELNSTINCDILIVSDLVINFNHFIELYDKNQYYFKHIFYMVSDNLDSSGQKIIPVLKAKKINYIPPKLTKSQIIERICSESGIKIVAHKNIAVFMGIDSKVGTTITTQAIAETLSKNTESTVCLMFLNGNPSIDYLPEEKNVFGLDTIKIKIINKILSPSELIDTCIKNENLYILPGLNSIMDARFYHPEHIENLISLASQTFGTVLIDAGSRLDVLMSIGALNSTNNRYLIGTQQDAARRNFERTKTQILSELDLDVKDFFLVVNKYVNYAELYTASQLANMYNTTLIGILPLLDYGWQTERDRKTLLNYDSSDYRNQILEIAGVIAGQLGVNFKHDNKKKTGFFAKLLR